MSNEATVNPMHVQHVSRGLFYIEIDGKWHQYSETAEVIKGVTGELKPPQWVIDHKEKQKNQANKPTVITGYNFDGVTIGAAAKHNLKIDDSGKVCGMQISPQSTASACTDDIKITNKRPTIEVGVLDISVKNNEVELFDGSQWYGIGFDVEEWSAIKQAVDRLILLDSETKDKRQLIKPKTITTPT